MPDEPLQHAIADRHAAGDDEMRANRARQLDEPQQPRPPAVDLGDAPRQPHDLRRDENDVENRARRKRRHQRNPLGRRGDLGAGASVERLDQRPLGDLDEIAPVDDFGRRPLDFRPRRRRLGPGYVERDEPRHGGAGEIAVVARMRRGEIGVQLGDAPLTRQRRELARRDPDDARQQQSDEEQADPTETLRLGPQTLDEIVDPKRKPERDEAAEAGPDQRRQRRPPAARDPDLLRRLDLAFALVERLRPRPVGNWRRLRPHLGRLAFIGAAAAVEAERARARTRVGHANAPAFPLPLG